MKQSGSGFIHLPLLVVLMVISVALPVASRLVSQNQTNQGRATNCEACNGLPSGVYEACRANCTSVSPPASSCNCNCAADKYTDQTCAGSCGQSCKGTMVRPTNIPPTSTPVPACTTTGICSNNSDCCSGECFGGLCQSTTTSIPQPTMTITIPSPSPTPEDISGGRKVLMKVENLEETPTVTPTSVVSVDAYAPSLQTTVKTINGQVYDTETGNNIGDLGANSDLLVTTGSKIGFTQVDQFDYVTTNSYQSAYVSDLFSKLDRVYQPTRGLPEALVGVPNQLDIVNQISSSVQNENLRQVNTLLNKQLVYNQEMVGVFSPASVGLDATDKVSYDAFVEAAWNNYNKYNRNIEVLVKDQKGVCFDFSVLMQMYLATKNVETELVFSRSLQHNFLLTLDKKDEVQVVDPTVGIVTSLATHSKEKQYTDLRFYKPIISPLSQTGNDASVQITTIAQKAVCQLKPLDPGCQDPSLLIPTK